MHKMALLACVAGIALCVVACSRALWPAQDGQVASGLDGELGSPPCNQLYSFEVGRSGPIVKCATRDGRKLNQCDAETTICNFADGWRLCPASTWKQALGTIALPSELDGRLGWIGSCIRVAGTWQAPSDTRCAQCTFIPGAWSTAPMWMCPPQEAVMPKRMTRTDWVGLTSGACQRLGINSAATEGLWLPTEASYSDLDTAFCCKP